MNKQLNKNHLTLALFMRDNTAPLERLSARRRKAFLDLREFDMAKEDEDGYVFNTEHGDKILDETIYQFAQLALAKP